LESESAPAKNKRKKGKIKKIYEMHQKGLSVKEISEKMNIGERLVQSYLWRSANPEKYKELLKRYFAKKKEKQQVKKKENA
jgi:orotate phosphoribosyltransferase-like protein